MISVISVTTPRQMELCRAIRKKVFQEEQHVPVGIEIDDEDDFSTTVHLLATEGNVPLGTLRILDHGDVAKIGRVAVVQEARGKSIGRIMMEYAMGQIARDLKFVRVELSAQMHVKGFYEKLGFEAFGEPFMDAGIPHVMMRRVL